MIIVVKIFRLTDNYDEIVKRRESAHKKTAEHRLEMTQKTAQYTAAVTVVLTVIE